MSLPKVVFSTARLFLLQIKKKLVLAYDWVEYDLTRLLNVF